ncbi:hypothetical protein LINGRAHAP2_LOCUS8345 [Linum grandiflorum]
MVWNLLGRWVFDGYRSNLIRWLPLLFSLRFPNWNINMRLLFFSSRSSVAVNGKLIFLIFTAKPIMLRTIWLILVIPSLMGYIFLIFQIEVCLTDYITVLLASICLVL